MQAFNAKWREWLAAKALVGTAHDCQAYKEFYRTKGLTAFNFEVQPVEKRAINQYYTLYKWRDGSALKISSHQNKVDLNTVLYYPRKTPLCFASRALFGCGSRMPWEA